MKIGIIGAGNVGGNIGTIWAEYGHEVFFGVRNPQHEKYAALHMLPNIQVGTAAEAAQFGEALLLAIAYRDIEALYPEIRNHVQGKILMDATNPVGPNLSGLIVGTTSSAAEEIQKNLPGGRVIKVFNNIGMANLRNLNFAGKAANTFLCSDHEADKQVVANLARLVGFDPVDAGPLTQARYVEPLAMLWITMAYKYGHGQEFAINLLKRN